MSIEKYPAQTKYSAKQKNKDLTRVSVWVHASNRKALIAEAKKLTKPSSV